MVKRLAAFIMVGITSTIIMRIIGGWPGYWQMAALIALFDTMIWCTEYVIHGDKTRPWSYNTKAPKPPVRESEFLR